MSGGWIKFEKDLADDPRVKRMARDLRNAEVTHGRFVSETHAPKAREYIAKILGGLALLWFYADKHIRDDNSIPLGVDDINEIVGIEGFAQIIPEHWLHVLDAETVELPDFLEHNGPEAKKAALNARRQGRHRDKVTLKDIEDKRISNASALTPELPDKTRQDQTKQDSKSKSARAEIAPRETESEIHSHILEIKAVYPKAAHEDWITAEKLIRNLVSDGGSWDVIQAGVERYAKFCKATSRIVANPGRWFADISRPWLSEWVIPAKPGQKPAPNHDAEWAEAKTLAKEIGFRDSYPGESASVYATAVRFARDTPVSVPIAERIGLAGIKRIGGT